MVKQALILVVSVALLILFLFPTEEIGVPLAESEIEAAAKPRTGATEALDPGEDLEYWGIEDTKAPEVSELAENKQETEEIEDTVSAKDEKLIADHIEAQAESMEKSGAGSEENDDG